jgi:adenosylcobinamide-GDP ribazoletransferase
LVGAVIGLLGAACGYLALWLGVNTAMAAILVIAVAAMITGALHEDGIADCADGLAGGNTPARRLEIMKDSRVGAFGVTALFLVLGARWSGTEALLPQTTLPVFAAIGAASRLPIVLAMVAMPLARTGGMAASVGTPPLFAICSAVAISLLICMASLGISGALLVLVGILAAVPLWYAAHRTIGGYTGDVLGGSQQLAEVATLAVATVFIL